MKLGSQEHDDLMRQFERDCKPGRIEREAKEYWPRGIVYQDGHVNEKFIAYRMGYAFGKVIGWSEESSRLDATPRPE